MKIESKIEINEVFQNVEKRSVENENVIEFVKELNNR